MIPNNNPYWNSIDNSVELRNIRYLQPRHILSIPKGAVKLLIENCASEFWEDISEAIATIKSLQSLTVRRCNSGSSLCQDLPDCGSLRQLAIEQCGLTQIGVRKIARLKNLEDLTIDDEEAMVNWSYFRVFKNLTRLRRLSMRNPNCTQLHLTQAGLNRPNLLLMTANLPGLTTLEVNKNDIGDEGASILARHLPLLTNLEIEATRITAAGLREICSTLNLANLRICDNDTGDEGALVVARYLPNLKELWISGCRLGQESLALLSTHLQGLKMLVCEGNPLCNRRCFTLGKFPSMKYLHMSTSGVYVAWRMIKDLLLHTLQNQMITLKTSDIQIELFTREERRDRRARR